MALAGGVTIEVPHGVGYQYHEGEILAPDGCCRAFDARVRRAPCSRAASAWSRCAGSPTRSTTATRSSPSSRARAVNNDGQRKVGYLAPSVDGHADVVKEALAVAGSVGSRHPARRGPRHRHGGRRPDRGRRAHRGLPRSRPTTSASAGSVSTKPNIGHLDTAAGVASLIKVVQALRHRTMPPLANLTAPSPLLDLDTVPVRALRRGRTVARRPRRAAPASARSGVGGTNAHVIVEEAPPCAGHASGGGPSRSSCCPGSDDAVTTAATANARRPPRSRTRDTTSPTSPTRSPPAAARIGTAGSSVATDTATPSTCCARTDRNRVAASTAPDAAPTVVFLFPGGGSQYVGMAAGLDERFDVFHEVIREGIELVAATFGASISSRCCARRRRATRCASPSRRCRRSSSRRSRSRGSGWRWASARRVRRPQPRRVRRRSARRRVLARRRARPRRRPRRADGAGERHRCRDARRAAARAERPPLLAPDALARGRQRRRRMRRRRPRRRHRRAPRSPRRPTAHTPTLDPARRGRLTARCSIRCSTSSSRWSQQRRALAADPAVPVQLTGTWITAEQATSPQYWVDHLRNTVRFAEDLASVLAEGPTVFIELGPGHSLSSYARRQETKPVAAIPALRHPNQAVDDTAATLLAFAKGWAAGLDVDVDRFTDDDRRVVTLAGVPVPPRPALDRARLRRVHGDGSRGRCRGGAGDRCRPDRRTNRRARATSSPRRRGSSRIARHLVRRRPGRGSSSATTPTSSLGALSSAALTDARPRRESDRAADRRRLRGGALDRARGIDGGIVRCGSGPLAHDRLGCGPRVGRRRRWPDTSRCGHARRVPRSTDRPSRRSTRWRSASSARHRVSTPICGPRSSTSTADGRPGRRRWSRAERSVRRLGSCGGAPRRPPAGADERGDAARRRHRQPTFRTGGTYLVTGAPRRRRLRARSPPRRAPPGTSRRRRQPRRCQRATRGPSGSTATPTTTRRAGGSGGCPSSRRSARRRAWSSPTSPTPSRFARALDEASAGRDRRRDPRRRRAARPADRDGDAGRPLRRARRQGARCAGPRRGAAATGRGPARARVLVEHDADAGGASGLRRRQQRARRRSPVSATASTSITINFGVWAERRHRRRRRRGGSRSTSNPASRSTTPCLSEVATDRDGVRARRRRPRRRLPLARRRAPQCRRASPCCRAPVTSSCYLAALRPAGLDATAWQSVTFLEPLVVPDGRPVTVRVTIRPSGTSGRRQHRHAGERRRRRALAGAQRSGVAVRRTGRAASRRRRARRRPSTRWPASTTQLGSDLVGTLSWRPAVTVRSSPGASRCRSEFAGEAGSWLRPSGARRRRDGVRRAVRHHAGVAVRADRLRHGDPVRRPARQLSWCRPCARRAAPTTSCGSTSRSATPTATSRCGSTASHCARSTSPPRSALPTVATDGGPGSIGHHRIPPILALSEQHGIRAAEGAELLERFVASGRLPRHRIEPRPRRGRGAAGRTARSRHASRPPVPSPAQAEGPSSARSGRSSSTCSGSPRSATTTTSSTSAGTR